MSDHKTIAEFRWMHDEAIKQAEAELIRFARFKDDWRLS